MVWPLLSVSVTVAVHVEACPTATVPGEQLTAVEVEADAVYVIVTCGGSPVVFALTDPPVGTSDEPPPPPPPADPPAGYGYDEEPF